MVNKKVIIINGSGGVGKDTICDIVANHYNVRNYSAIDPIKKIALENGWNGEKDDKARKLLSDLKSLFVEFNDLPFVYITGRYKEFSVDPEAEILFLHIREGSEITKTVNGIRALGGDCTTLLIRGRADVKEWHNTSDAGVENYRYDHIYNNIGPLATLDHDFMDFFENEIFSREELTCSSRQDGYEDENIDDIEGR